MGETDLATAEAADQGTGAVVDVLGRKVPLSELRALPPVDPAPALRAADRSGLLPRCDAVGLLQPPAAVLYDLDAWENQLAACQTAFGDGFLHAIALKSNSVAALMRRARDLGLGAECASIGEVLHALAIGFAPDRIVFDSPVKTRAEIAFALEQGVHLNVDSFQELERVAAAFAAPEVGSRSSATVGVRINPLIGAGQIAALSVSTSESKFGIPVTLKEELLAAFRKHEFLTCVHVHSGSGGMGAKQLVAGIRVAVDFAQEVNASLGAPRVACVDIGGGWPVNYGSDSYTDAPKVGTFFDYAAELRAAVPELWSGEFRVVSEFGQSLNAKAGFLASRVEYTKPFLEGQEGCTATLHFGADTCVRQAYTGDHQRRVEAFDARGEPKRGGEGVPHNIAGPLCFQGDFIAKGMSFPQLEPDDIVVLREAGANTLSLFSRHCSRFAPAVYGFRDGALEELKPVEPPASISAFWGASAAEQEQLKKVLAAAARKP